MKKCLKDLLVFGALSMVFSLTPQTASANPGIWYDADRQAIAIDPYADGWGGRIEIDFNSDHTWAGIIDQSGYYYLLGYVTDLGLRKYTVTQYPGGGSSISTVYGWGPGLGTLHPAIDYASYVKTLYYGAEASDKFHYFTDIWNVAANSTTIYIQPTNLNSSNIPVRPEDLENVYFKFSGMGSDWQRFTDVFPQTPDPIAVNITINPQTLNRKSNGKWIACYIEVPTGHSVEDILLDSLTLSVNQDTVVDTTLEKSVLYRVGPTDYEIDTSTGVATLMVKFDRSDLISLLAAGEADIQVTGVLTDDTPIIGTVGIRVK